MIPFPNISPEIFSFTLFGVTFALRWYALSYIFGFICALQIMKFFVNREALWLKKKSTNLVGTCGLNYYLFNRRCNCWRALGLCSFL